MLILNIFILKYDFGHILNADSHLKGLHPSLLLNEFDSCIRLHLHMLSLQFIHEPRLIEEI